MGALIAIAGTWLGRFVVLSFLAKIAGLFVFVTVSTALLDYMIGHMFSMLGQYGPVTVLQLAGVDQALGIMAGGLTLRLTLRRLMGIGLGSGITG